MKQKQVEVRCACGNRRTFRGRSAVDIISKIDASGWSDEPGGGRGWMPGSCEDCNRELETSVQE